MKLSNFDAVAGKCISNIAIEGDKMLRVTFADGTGLVFEDDGQDCCEHRYMHSDDPLGSYAGSQFLGAELREYKENIGGVDYDVLDCQFLAILTSSGTITVANYNHHNGYYGGFDIRCKES